MKKPFGFLLRKTFAKTKTGFRTLMIIQRRKKYVCVYYDPTIV